MERIIKDKKSIALIVGAGAVDKAWLPVCRAIQPVHFKSPISDESANVSLARLVYNMRYYKRMNNEEAFSFCKELYEIIKQQISESIKYAQANNEIKARQTLYQIIEKLIIPNLKNFMLVSTNWDTVVDDAINNFPEFTFMFGATNMLAGHIHGSYLDPRSLYLPTEMTAENYRTEEEENYFGERHSSLMRQLPKAEMVIIYGLSLSALDAELYQVLGASFNRGMLEFIYIIDLNPKAVAEKVNLLLEEHSKVRVFGCTPDSLDNPIEYSFNIVFD